MHQRYKDRVKFLFVYVREAHPSDGWQMPQNEEQKVVFAQPKSAKERHGIAVQCCERLKLTMPCVVDGMDNKVDELYAGWPERLFIITPDGKVAYAGQVGPFGFDPDDMEAKLKKIVPAAAQ